MGARTALPGGIPAGGRCCMQPYRFGEPPLEPAIAAPARVRRVGCPARFPQTKPPSVSSVRPVIQRLSSQARKATALAMSSRLGQAGPAAWRRAGGP